MYFKIIKMPFYSIVLPLYNKENFIQKTVESVLNQSFFDFELIIINDGSTDSSEKIISKFNDLRIKYFLKENEGVAKARNFGIEKSSADYICFLDADDYWNVDYLKTMHFYINNVPDQYVFSSAIEIETKKTIFAASYSIKKTGDFEVVNFFEASQKNSILWTSSAIIHKNVFEKTGTFDTLISKGEDTDMWIRIGLNYPIVFIWKILSRYVYDASSISRNNKYFLEEYTFNKYLEIEKENKLLKKFLDLNRFSAAVKCKINGNNLFFNKMISSIDSSNLNFKKRIILKLPAFMLRFLIQVKIMMVRFGLENSVFK